MRMAGEPSQPRCLAAIRIRGGVNLRRDVKETLAMLHLTRSNYATLIPSTPQYLGMLRKTKEYVTWGEVSMEGILTLLEKRGEVKGGVRLREDYLREKLKINSFKELGDALLGLRLKFTDLEGVKPLFRLHPPSKGFKRTVKKAFGEGGELAYRGEKINELIEKMA